MTYTHTGARGPGPRTTPGYVSRQTVGGQETERVFLGFFFLGKGGGELLTHPHRLRQREKKDGADE